MRQKNRELKLIFAVLVLVFAAFLAVPVLRLLVKSFWGEQGVTGEFYTAVFTGRNFGQTLMNSFAVSAAAAVAAVLVAFVLAYAVHYTRLPGWVKTALRGAATLPMFIPTITYGFAIIYSFGKQGLITQLLGFQLFNIYGFWGLLVGYVIYTVPVAFLLICNTMEYVDKKTLVVSKVMGDGALSTFWIAVLRPLLGTLAGAFVQAFFLCFTDFGIPASVGGKFDVIATVLYNQMLGGIPDFNRGAVVAVIMLLPSVGSILLLRFLERYNIRYDRVSSAELKRNPLRDGAWGLSGAVLGLMLLSIFVVIFLVPMVQNWPYQRTFTPEHFASVFADKDLRKVYLHSLAMALLTAFFGTLAAYGGALITARSTLPRACKQTMDSVALVTNTIPGMVLGLAFLFCFRGTSLQNTFVLMILCNIVHYFSTPYLMMKNALSKMNAGWETTALLMGDSWPKTIFRVVTPNAAASLIETFSYYFINSMVTMSTFYLQSAQDQNQMFVDLTFDVNTLEEVPSYTAPITSQEGAIIVNTQLLEENNLPMPTCLKDLADPVYAGFLAVTDVQSSSTAWLLMQALVSAYGEEEAQSILHDIYVNAGDHIESSGSAPLKLCQAGEIAVGFGLRHQAVAAKAEGMPIDYVDPTEGNFSLTESVAIIDKGEETNPLAMEMAQCIIDNGRAELQENYPNPLYEGESSDAANKSAYPKVFEEPLTFELYKHHQDISEAAKP